MDMLLRFPHGFIRRHLSKVERGLVAAGMAGLLYLLMLKLPAYPLPWEMVIATAVFVVMLWSPAVAFFLAVTAALYPLYTLSLYIAVLFLAIALLGQRIFIYNLGATLLVLATPWLAQIHMAWVVPLMGGLILGKNSGAWMGGLAALWGLTLAGMTGREPDWLLMTGHPLAIGRLLERFAQANSLDTLKLILLPLAPDATLLLYHLLQVVMWAMVAGLIGGLAERAWTQRHRPFGSMLLVATGATVLAGGHLWLAYWLEQYPPLLLVTAGPNLALDALLAVLVVSILEGLRDFFEHPLPTRRRWVPAGSYPATAGPDQAVAADASGARSRLARFFRRKTKPAEDSTQLPLNFTPLPVPPDLPKSDRKKQHPDDLIKIELD